MHDCRRRYPKEGSKVEPGTPIALIENWWAVFQLNAKGQGILKKTFSDPGTSITVGDPIAIIGGNWLFSPRQIRLILTMELHYSGQHECEQRRGGTSAHRPSERSPVVLAITVAHCDSAGSRPYPHA